MITLDEIVKCYDLKKHPEGGYFSETYRSTEIIQTQAGQRNLTTCIYYLLPQGSFSKFHRIQSDEIWHFYLGGPMVLYEITSNGSLIETVLGQDLKLKQRLQYVVKAGHWFGGCPLSESEFSLVGCTVSPGFDFRDFEMADRKELLKSFPQLGNIIETLT